MSTIDTGRARRGLGAALVIGAVVATAAACGSSSGGGQPSTPSAPSTLSAPSTPGTPSTPSTQSTTPATSAPPTTGGATAVGSSASPATLAAIKSAYTKLFAPDTPLKQSINSLQNGEKFKQAIVSQGKSTLASKSSAKVSKVTLISPDAAKVTFSILLAGSPVLPDQSGYAVREDGTWKVADVTFCGLLRLQGDAPPACNSAAATTVPE